MGKKTFSHWIFAGMVFLILISSCSISGPEVSIEDRIEDFEDDLDAGKIDQLYKHVHPDNSKRNQLKSADAWPFPGTESYDFKDISDSGENRKVTVETTDGQWSSPITWTFEMKEDAPGPLARSTWYIDDISSQSGPDPMP